MATTTTRALGTYRASSLTGNGVKDGLESNLNDRTVILIDVAKTIEMIDSGSIGDLDVGTAVAGALESSPQASRSAELFERSPSSSTPSRPCTSPLSIAAARAGR